MIAPDTSVLIAGTGPGHVHFGLADRALDAVLEDGVLVAHTMAEAFAVLTAPAYRWAPAAVRAYLGQYLERRPIGVAPRAYPSAVERIAAAGISGGAVYDALIGLGASAGGATLVSLDHRAARTYERCDVDYRLLS